MGGDGGFDEGVAKDVMEGDWTIVDGSCVFDEDVAADAIDDPPSTKPEVALVAGASDVPESLATSLFSPVS